MPLTKEYYSQDVLELAPDLLGKLLCHKMPDGRILKQRITETEAYRGEDDTACHAHKGRTPRTETLYQPGGTAYIYLCYGIHSLFNVVTGQAESPQAVLIRGVENFSGPGRLTKALAIDRSLNGIWLPESQELWLEDDGYKPEYTTAKRVGIDYASREDIDRLWRFLVV